MLSVQQISPLRVNQGGSVYVFGSGFDCKCKVLADNGTPSQIAGLTVLDYDDNSLEFVAPKETGSYDVLVVRENILFGRFSLTVVALSELNVWNIARRDNVVRDGVDYENEEFRSALLGLLPRGFAWFKGKVGNWWKLFAGFSLGFSAVYKILRDLVFESSPAKTTSYETWERELGLPIKGVERDSASGKLAEIYRISRKKGGVTVSYFKSISSLFGLNVSIYEYWKSEDRPKFEGVDFGDDDPNFCWLLEIEAESSDWRYCTCNDTCNDYLQFWWNEPVESLYDAIKPAHTKLLYAYKEVERELVVVDDSNDVVVVNDNTPIVASVLSGHIVNPVPIELPSGEKVLGIRVKDLPDAQNDDAYMLRDSDVGGTTKTGIVGDSGFDSLWDNTPADPADDDTNETEGD